MRVAIAQCESPVLDARESMQIAARWIERAANEGATLVAFGESFIGGYPAWVDWPGWSDFRAASTSRLFARMLEQAIDVRSDTLDPIRSCCERHRISVIIGANERSTSGKSLYNALLFFDNLGELALVRRKLVPTHGERLAWAPARDVDHAGLRAARLGDVPVSGLMCWEHWMPLARYALHRDGPLVHVAAWPHAGDLHHLASRHMAFEGGCFVVCAALLAPREQFDGLEIPPPADFNGLHGGSAIIAPDTSFVVEPIAGREKLLLAQLDLDRAREAAFRLDVAGHYDRADLAGQFDGLFDPDSLVHASADAPRQPVALEAKAD